MGRWVRGEGVGPKFIDPDKMVFSAFKNVTWVQGVLLNRFAYDESKSTEDRSWYWVYKVPDTKIEISCDGCARTHRSTNMECSATLGVRTMYTDPSKLYEFKGQVVVPYPEILDTVTSTTVIEAIVFKEFPPPPKKK
jgi:hypothetical protein